MKTTYTKRDFDADTKENWECDGMARDERESYRARRFIDDGRTNYIDRRAADMRARNNCPGAVALDGYLPTLGIGSRWRTPARVRAHNRLPMLGNA